MKERKAKADKRRQILEAACSCFAQNGFAATRLDDIAEKAKVAKGTIYLHFENKDSLYLALFRETLDELFDTIDSAVMAVDSFAEKAQCAIRLYLEFFEHNREKFSIF
ncbi:MAG TPA: helix-turn-helix domain-containing protein, partial [Candidatus Ozemobacteraceae bacterium]|nr:helix-turn-helix domain-containing protein [Candidatus Ozemobacteraceae bacterium]